MSWPNACIISLALISTSATASQQAVDPRTDLPYRIVVKEGEWKVLRKIPRSSQWALVENYAREGAHATARSIAIDGSGYIYVAGETQTVVSETKASNWIVRRSIDEGRSWQTVDEVPGAEPHVIAVTDEGEVFAAGSSRDEWVTRYSPNGVHWSEVDRIHAPGRAAALSASVEVNGNVRIHGIVTDRQGHLQALSRQTHAAFPMAWH